VPFVDAEVDVELVGDAEPRMSSHRGFTVDVG